ncbi:DUF5686 and carboxypeptidase regulatory-like domain-containing protein [Aliifodinibius salicampi]|uniref:DUF5686 and carboxypeptidase regulatory-like domain-containing protein n=1 Tax=Fodinibius salicampi TaxID=1920655 RepID=A0ABT3PYU5_9BACT|nr:DUF5686 and carboxypeptidase-like regulatory domain-containing protein [Fodinibius salicampi]MCW9713035.1 DUF5686 and carboxypeptidase regulatory-like domain-containing protein [Fodinibius salicampi]
MDNIPQGDSCNSSTSLDSDQQNIADFFRISKIFWLLILLLLTLVATPTPAQTVIRGTVTDTETGETLPSANISIKNTYRGTISNENGNYTLSIPDSLLPATLIVRYIGYHTLTKPITRETPQQQDLSLQPSVTEMDEIVVTDENPATRIMREVIRRKQQWRQGLNTYQAEAYTRQSLANDTSIVSITESISQVFWDKEQGHREVLKSKRQTANIQSSANFAGVSYLPNLYDDNVDIAGFELMGITHPDALDYYNFKLVDQTSRDDQTVYEIEVIPARKLQPLFRGTAFVLDEEYALLKVDLEPNEVVTFPRPVKSFNTSYQQQFNNFGRDFWLPIDMRITGDVKVSMIGLNFPLIRFKQLSRVSNYEINTSLPDSLYQQEETFTTDSTAQSDSLLVQRASAVPLSQAEEEAYANLDSTATLEKAFKPSGFLSRFVDDEDDEQESDSGSGFNPMQYIPGQLMPNGRFNRVDELFAGLKYEVQPFDRLTLRGNGGYSTGYEEWSYGGGLSVRWLNKNSINATVGWDYNARTSTRYTSHIYNPYFTIIPNLLGNDGYFDYYRSEGYRTFSKWDNFGPDLSLEIGFNSEDHRSLPTTTAYDFLGKSNNYRFNPAINEGRLNSLDLVAGYNINEGYNFGVTGQKYIRFEIEHSSDKLGSDFNFTRYETRLAWSFPTFYQRRLFPNTLDVGIKAGTFSGDLPYQKMGVIDGALGPISPYGILRAARGRPYEGEQYIALHAEHDFRTIPFEAIGLQPLVERNIGLILFGGAARTWGPTASHIPAQSNQTYLPNGTGGIHWEAGASLNGILGLFRVDIATRIDQPAVLVNVGVARLF